MSWPAASWEDARARDCEDPAAALGVPAAQHEVTILDPHLHKGGWWWFCETCGGEGGPFETYERALDEAAGHKAEESA